jgi:hypothetical protein
MNVEQKGSCGNLQRQLASIDRRVASLVLQNATVQSRQALRCEIIFRLLVCDKKKEPQKCAY